MSQKTQLFMAQSALAIAAIFFTSLATAFTPPTLPVHVGKLSADGLSNRCLEAGFYGYSANFPACDLGVYATNENVLFGSDSTTVTTAMGGCLSPDASILDSYTQYPINSYGVITNSPCGDGSSVAKYDPASKQIVFPLNGRLACLAAVYLTQNPPHATAGNSDWKPIFVDCSITNFNSQPVYKTWSFTPQNTPTPTPSLVNQYNWCLTLAPNDPSATYPFTYTSSFTTCVFGDPNQHWIYNQNHQITNEQGQCLAAYNNEYPNSPGYYYTTQGVDDCKLDANHFWEFTGNNQLVNSSTQQCLGTGSSIIYDCNNPNAGFNFYFLTGPQPPTNNLVAKNDSYAVTSNTSRYQGIDQPAAKGVRVNDLPSGWPDGLTFELVSPITRTGGTGKGTAELYFRDSGGFYVLLKSDANSNANRRADKRGTYTFTYKMVMNGQSSAPATVTINVI